MTERTRARIIARKALLNRDIILNIRRTKCVNEVVAVLDRDEVRKLVVGEGMIGG